MIITKEISLDQFEPWSGAVSTFDRIYNEGKMDDLEFILEDMYPEGIDEGHLNDLFWFEEDWLFDMLDISDEDDEDEDDDDFRVDDWEEDEDEDDLDEGCNRRTVRKLKEEITDEVYACAEEIANEIEKTGVMHFSEVEERIIYFLNMPVEDIDSDIFSDVYSLLGYMGIDVNYSSGDFYTQEYAESHPEVYEESKKRSKRKGRNIKESLYSDEEVQETAEEILSNYRLEGTNFEDLGVNLEGISVCVTDLVSGMDFWFDLWIDNGDMDGDWNQYIFHLNHFGDRVRQYLQDTTYFFEDVMGEAENYAIAHGIIVFDEDTNRYEWGN